MHEFNEFNQHYEDDIDEFFPPNEEEFLRGDDNGFSGGWNHQGPFQSVDDQTDAFYRDSNATNIRGKFLGG